MDLYKNSTIRKRKSKNQEKKLNKIKTKVHLKHKAILSGYQWNMCKSLKSVSKIYGKVKYMYIDEEKVISNLSSF